MDLVHIRYDVTIDRYRSKVSFSKILPLLIGHIGQKSKSHGQMVEKICAL